MLSRNIKPIRLAASTCLLLLLIAEMENRAVRADTRKTSENQEDIHEYLKETFPEFLYHGAYLDEENHYLVISLKIHPGQLAKTMEQEPGTIDEVLARILINNLYKGSFSYYLYGTPKIRGVSVILTWEECQRVRDKNGEEKILLMDGRSEFDRFVVSRGLYFEKLGLVQNISDPFSAGKLFDEITFSHLMGESYKGILFHQASDSP
jgi:hypothetical protein